MAKQQKIALNTFDDGRFYIINMKVYHGVILNMNMGMIF